MECLKLTNEESSADALSSDAVSEAPKCENVTAEPASKDESSESCQQKSTCKALSDGHISVKIKLKQALSELAEKETQFSDLEEDAVRHRDKTWLLEERIRIMNEKLCSYKRYLDRQVKKQDDMLLELSDIKWKIEETKTFLEKLKVDCLEMEKKKKQRQKVLEGINGEDAQSMQFMRQELQQEINKLLTYKSQLQNGDVQTCAILNGNKLIELTQRKQAITEAIEERSARYESLYVEIDEKDERVQQLKKSIENAQKQHQDTLRDRKNHCAYLAETELRLQRSVDYLRAKIDYGTYVPAPWPNLRESLKFKT